LLGQVLIGAAELDGEARKENHFILAIDGAVFRSRAVVEAEADSTLDQIAAAPPGPGLDAIRIPGDSAATTRERRLREGIPLHEESWRGIREAAALVGVTLPEGPR
jgi:LDH2 family malate/lactate/ureidoglycolate dehydrogenase